MSKKIFDYGIVYTVSAQVLFIPVVGSSLQAVSPGFRFLRATAGSYCPNGYNKNLCFRLEDESANRTFFVLPKHADLIVEAAK